MRWKVRSRAQRKVAYCVSLVHTVQTHIKCRKHGSIQTGWAIQQLSRHLQIVTLEGVQLAPVEDNTTKVDSVLATAE